MDLIVNSILSNKFESHLSKIKSLYNDPPEHDIIDLKLGILSYYTSAKKYEAGYTIPGWYWYAKHPSLLLTLIRYHPDKLRFILENWKLFYPGLHLMVYDIVVLFTFFPCFSDINYNSDIVKFLIDYCGNVDIIPMINEIQCIEYRIEHQFVQLIFNPKFINYLVWEHDTEYKYEQQSCYTFLYYFIYISNDLSTDLYTKYYLEDKFVNSKMEDKVKGYNLIKYDDVSKTMKTLLANKNTKMYLLLYNLGFRLLEHEYNPYLFLVYNKLGHTISRMSFTNFLNVMLEYCGGYIKSYSKIKIKYVMLLVDKYTQLNDKQDSNIIYDAIKYFENNATIPFNYLPDSMWGRLFIFMYASTTANARNGYVPKYDDYIIKYGYSIDAMLIRRDSPKIWKYCFMAILRFEHNFTLNKTI